MNLHNPLEAVRLWMANWSKLMVNNLYVKIRSQEYPPAVFTASIHQSILHAMKEFSKNTSNTIAPIDTTPIPHCTTTILFSSPTEEQI